MMRQGDNDNRRQHENSGGHDRARREPRDAADAVAGRAAVAEPGAKADQKAGDGDNDGA